MQKSGRLELNWVGKDEEIRVEPRILLEDAKKSYGDPSSENMLIHGDNLIALKALERDFFGMIKCIYIDPPYNTGSAFAQYDDGLEHSQWLNMMKPRLEILYNLLSDDGSIWISIDDDECHYLKVLCDEIFGRYNFVSTVIWEKKYSPQNDARWLSDSHDYILVYAKNKAAWKPNLLPRTDEMNARYKNPDNDPRGVWKPGDCLRKDVQVSGLYEITTPSGRVCSPPPGRSWRYAKDTFLSMIKDNRIWFGEKGDNIPQVKRFLSDVKQGMTAMTIWKYSEVGHNQEATREARVFNPEDPFATPKPERLIERIITLASNSGDWVLDSFLGCGTTAAVAHKMKRRYIGVELGDHAYTHCKRRLDMVVDGEQGGISSQYHWHGGGGYHFYELAPSLLTKNPKLHIYQINPEYDDAMLCEAICKIEGFQYAPSGVFHGYSSEKRYIYVTTSYVNAELVMSVASRLDFEQSLLICGTKVQSDLVLPDNIEVKRIPKDLLDKCSFESEV